MLGYAVVVERAHDAAVNVDVDRYEDSGLIAMLPSSLPLAEAAGRGMPLHIWGPCLAHRGISSRPSPAWRYWYSTFPIQHQRPAAIPTTHTTQLGRSRDLPATSDTDVQNLLCRLLTSTRHAHRERLPGISVSAPSLRFLGARLLRTGADATSGGLQLLRL
jgi:hypothetical protein